ncbi:MAG: RdgB/HAM1 family non-canonical purine NTP pyrophosphatase [Acidobacteriaceae bacterium]|nr:RdgB/HAM1 family non-canonical purine NTP pyrophosphatase [Acidobacteriaceae bacterium]
MTVYACSSNANKLKEFELAAGEIKLEPLPRLGAIAAPEETGATFEENAAIKAVYYSGFTAELVFADDSGLEVDALGGAPGVHSARYAGAGATDQANNELVLRNLGNASNREARFVCVIALARNGAVLKSFRGTVEGAILRQSRGAGGFGYDPLFFYAPLDCSLAELGPEEKFAVGHRGQAARAMCDWLREENGI